MLVFISRCKLKYSFHYGDVFGFSDLSGAPGIEEPYLGVMSRDITKAPPPGFEPAHPAPEVNTFCSLCPTSEFHYRILCEVQRPWQWRYEQALYFRR